MRASENSLVVVNRGVQVVIIGDYWLQPLTANRLGGYYILPTASANRIGGGGYINNCGLAVIDYITSSYITAFEYGFWACFGSILSGFGHFLGHFSADFKIKIQKFLISNKSKSSINKIKSNKIKIKIQIQIQIQIQNICSFIGSSAVLPTGVTLVPTVPL